MLKFNNLALGGTFDRLHIGHKVLLDISTHFSDFLHIGLTSDNYLQLKPKLGNDSIQSFNTRLRNLQNYITSKDKQADIIKLNYPKEDLELMMIPKINALVVSEETYYQGLIINNLREKNNFKRLKLIIIPSILSKNGEKISSSKIRCSTPSKDSKLKPSQNSRSSS